MFAPLLFTTKSLLEIGTLGYSFGMTPNDKGSSPFSICSRGFSRLHGVALLSAALLACHTIVAAPFLPAHRYSFDNAAGGAPSGSIVSDSIGAANGTVLGAGATFTGSRLTLPGGGSATAAYVDLPNNLLSVNSTNNGGPGAVTIEGWVKVTGSRTWSRIFDFGSSGPCCGTGSEVLGPGGGGEGIDYIMLSAQNDNNTSVRRFEFLNRDQGDHGNTTVDHGTTFNVDSHFVVTWDEATGQMRVYENGVQKIATSTAAAMSELNDVNVWLGRSNWTTDQNMQGEFDEFRIYNQVMSGAQVLNSFRAGPNTFATGAVQILTQPQNLTVSEENNAVFSVVAIGQLPMTFQWYRGNSAVLNATNETFAFTPAHVSDNNAQLYVIISNVVNGVAYSATSSVATLTVLGDTNAPTALQVRLNGSAQLEVIFSEAVRAQDATNLANYTLTGPSAPSITGAAISANGTRVVLTLSGPLTVCDFYNLAISGIHDVSASGNLMAPATVNFWNYALPGLTHRYTFNNAASANATGATVPDAVGTADGVVRNGTGTTTFTGNRVTLSGGSSATAPYVDLPNNLLSNNSTNRGGTGQLTFEGWVKVTGVQSWSRILDFGSTTGGELLGPGGGGNGLDYLFYSAMNGVDPTIRRIDFTNHDPIDQGAAGQDFGTSTFNQDFHFVITWDEATGQIRVYENGLLAGSAVTDDPMSDINDVNVWLGRSNWVNDSNMQGEFDEFRIYSRVLSSQDIQLDRIAGPDNNFGALLGFDLVPTTNSMVTNTVDTVRALARFSNAGTQNVASAGCVVYSSTASNVAYISADGVLHALDSGMATVTATLGGITDSEVIEVTQDATPPTLLFARANGSRLIEVAFSEPVELGTSEEAGNYSVSSASGPIDITSVQRSSDPSRVLLTLSSPLPCEYITVRVSFVADQSPLFNQIVENSPISFMNYVPTGLQHRYTFNNGVGAATPGAIVPDAAGSGDAFLLGAGATFTGNRVVLPGGPSSTAAYIDLPNGLLSRNGVANGGSGKITIEGWVQVTGNRTWSRIFDFGSSGPCCNPGIEITGPGGGGEGIDYLMLSAQNGNDVNTRRLEIKNRDDAFLGELTIDHPALFNHYDHFVVTWDEATDQIRAYENGVLVSSASSVAPFSSINDVNVWLGRSTWTADQNLQGEFDEFRVYNRILSTNEMAFNESIGPDNNLGQPLALRISAPSPVQIGNFISPTVRVDFASSSNVNMTAAGCYTLQSSDPSVISVDPLGVVQAVGNGTAALIARFSGLSNSVPVTVGGGAGTQGQVRIERSGGNYIIRYSGGTPGTTYRVERTTSLTAPITWTTIATLPAAPDGTLMATDASPPPNQAFYRVVTP